MLIKIASEEDETIKREANVETAVTEEMEPESFKLASPTEVTPSPAFSPVRAVPKGVARVTKGALPVEVVVPSVKKPRKLLSLQYNYSDSDDDETREERKARIVSITTYMYNRECSTFNYMIVNAGIRLQCIIYNFALKKYELKVLIPQILGYKSTSAIGRGSSLISISLDMCLLSAISQG